MMDCPFCTTESSVLRNELAYAQFDINPVTKGHLLLLPIRHVPTYFEASTEERNALFDLLEQGKHMLDQRFHPDGYNIGVNVGEIAGQTIMHLHIHLIPRYQGDCDNPRGGVRGVIPAKQSYPVHKEMPHA